MNRYGIKHNNSDSFGVQAAFLTVAGALITLVSYGCSFVSGTEGGAADTVKASGFTDVTVTSTKRFLPGFRGCDKNDYIGFDLEAINSTGQPVTLTVCSAPFKGDTIRDTKLVPEEDQDVTTVSTGSNG